MLPKWPFALRGRVGKVAHAKPHSRRALTFETLEPREMLTVTLLLDYSLDSGLFALQSRRDLLQAVANEIGARLTDSLAAFPTSTYTITNPATGSTTTSTFNSPADTIRIFVSGSPLAGSTAGQGGWWTNTGIRSYNTSTDFAPYVGYLRFDNDGSTSWDFSGGPANFQGIARHEMLHVLGIGGAPTWNNLISSGFFTGAKARAANGGLNPQVTPDKGHFAAGVNSIMTAMVSRNDITDLDWGALDDIGWDVTTAGPSYPDLIGASFNVVQEPLRSGDNFNVDFQVRNTASTAAGPFDVRFYISRNSSFSSINDRLLGSSSFSSLAANSTSSSRNVAAAVAKPRRSVLDQRHDVLHRHGCRSH